MLRVKFLEVLKRAKHRETIGPPRNDHSSISYVDVVMCFNLREPGILNTCCGNSVLPLEKLYMQ